MGEVQLAGWLSANGIERRPFITANAAQFVAPQASPLCGQGTRLDQGGRADPRGEQLADHLEFGGRDRTK